MESLSETKVCTKCGVEKSVSQFGKYASSKDGLRHNCKSCRNSQEAKYRESNWEDIYQKKREWRQENLEKSRESSRTYYYKTREKYLADHKSKYSEDEKFRETKRTRNANWRKANPEKNAMKTMRRYARKKSVSVEKFSIQDMLDKWGTDCYICGKPIDLSAPRNCRGEGWELGLHEEHVIPISGGGAHSLDNVKPAHALCNLKKSH